MTPTYPFTVRSSLPRFKTTSPGEDLWLALRDLYVAQGNTPIPSPELIEISKWVEPSGALAHHHIDAALCTAVYKLLKIAKRIEKDAQFDGNNLRTPEAEAILHREISQYMVEHMGFAALDLGARRLIPDLVFRSLLTTKADIGPTTRQIVYDEAEERSKRASIECYCCGDDIWTALSKESRKNIPLDHVWPRTLGGASTPENLLPICHACNQAKEDRASWSVYGVVYDHAFAERDPKAELMTGMTLHRCAAGKLALNCYTSLKEAFIQLGPRTSLQQIDPAAGDHFFNFTAHDKSKLSELW